MGVFLAEFYSVLQRNGLACLYNPDCRGLPVLDEDLDAAALASGIPEGLKKSEHGVGGALILDGHAAPFFTRVSSSSGITLPPATIAESGTPRSYSAARPGPSTDRRVSASILARRLA